MNKGTSIMLAAACAAVAAVAVGVAGAATPKKPAATTAAAAVKLPPLPAGAQRVLATLDAAHSIPKATHALPGAVGTFVGTLEGSLLRYTLTFDHLSGVVTFGQIHFGSAKTDGKLAQPLCVPCLAPETGAIPLYPDQLIALKAGRLYVVLETASEPAGEVRGQLQLSNK